MNEHECLTKMVAPGMQRAGVYRDGILQILVTSQCDKSCFHCTQASQLRRKAWFMTPDQYRVALESLRGYFGVIGLFGGNPVMSPHFADYCAILRQSWVPFEQRGIWSNNPRSLENAQRMRETFNPRFSNLNVHMDLKAYQLFKEGWPESNILGLNADSRHSPCFVSMKDLDVPEEERWRLIAGCDINQRWSAMIGVFRGELRGWFCEVAGAQAILHQDDPDYPDTGLDVTSTWNYEGPAVGISGRRVSLRDAKWWQAPMGSFAQQVRKHCHECSVPLRGYGELACSTNGKEQVSVTHLGNYLPKAKDRPVQVVDRLELLNRGRIEKVNHYLQNARV